MGLYLDLLKEAKENTHKATIEFVNDVIYVMNNETFLSDDEKNIIRNELLKNIYNGSIPNQDQQNCVFNPSSEKKPGVCVIPAKAIRKEGESEEKNIRHDNGFNS